MLERRVRPIVQPWIEEEQRVLRPGLETTNQLFTLARMSGGAWEFAQLVYMRFVDLEKAYDQVPYEILWEVLQEYGVRGSLLRAIQSLYAQSQSCVRILGSKSDFASHFREKSEKLVSLFNISVRFIVLPVTNL